MKRSAFFNLLLTGIVLTIGGAGCKHPQKPVTPLPERRLQAPPPGGGSGRVGPVDPGSGTRVGPGIGQGTPVIPDTTTQPTRVTELPPPSRTPDNPSGFKQPDELLEGYLPDTNRFAADTVYFEFDSFVVRTSQHPNCNVVGDELKAKPETALMIDGHCDERGTEEYNRALGEHRALAIREYLIKYGIAQDRIRTRSWGENRPADPGHDDAAWAKNRRGEFILLLPPGK
jgi:peptidoglycan-associated lipoprotein